MILSSDVMGRIAADPDLTRDFETLCSFGGRLAGTESERLAMDFVGERGARASGVSCQTLPVNYGGWRVPCEPSCASPMAAVLLVTPSCAPSQRHRQG